MTVLEALILRGWLELVAPRLSVAPGAPVDAIAADAVAVLSPRYGGREKLAGAMGNALRRACATVIARIDALPDDKAIPACLRAERPFRDLMDADVDPQRGLSQALETIRPLRGYGAQIAPMAIREMVIQLPEVLPRLGPHGLEPLIELIRRWEDRLEGALKAAALRDRGSAHSLLGQGAEARACFEACGDKARAILESADDALEAGRVMEAIELAEQARAAAEDPATESAALRRLGVAAAMDGRREDAEARLREARDVARAAGDGRAEAEALEEMSRLAADRGEVWRAVTLLGAVWKTQRAMGHEAGAGRALQLAGRILCEGGKPVDGLLMLVEAKAIAERYDPHVADLIATYATGFQYTLGRDDFDRLEDLLEQPRLPVILRAFATARCLAPDALV